MLLWLDGGHCCASPSLFVLYLSLFPRRSVFFNFQWDYLLLEAGFLSIFLSAGPKLPAGIPVSLAVVSAALSYQGCPEDPHGRTRTWANPPRSRGTTSRPALPHGVLVPTSSRLAAAGPAPDSPCSSNCWCRFSSFFTPFRLFAALHTITIQVLIILTSNHNFIGLLTIAVPVPARRPGPWCVPPRWLRSDTSQPTAQPDAEAVLHCRQLAGVLLWTSARTIHDFVTGRAMAAAGTTRSTG